MDRTDNEPRAREPWAGRRRADGTAEAEAAPSEAGAPPPQAEAAPSEAEAQPSEAQPSEAEAQPSQREAPPSQGATPPPHEEAPPPPPPWGRMDFSPFFVLLDALRRAIPGDMQNQFTRLVRETLMTIRGLIDWYLERLERPEPDQRVEDIPID